MDKMVWRELLFRPSPSPRVALPISARSVGFQRVSRGYSQSPARRPMVELIWAVSGEAHIYLRKAWRLFRARQVAVYRPNDAHRLAATSDRFECWWLTWDGPLAVALLDAFGLAAGPRDAGPCPVAAFMALQTEIQRVAVDAARRACVLAFEIMSAAASDPGRSRPRHPVVQTCLRLIEERLSDHELNVNTLADAVRRHRSSLSRLFRQEMDCAPSLYIQTLRQQRALQALRSTKLSIARIARDCGYADPEYFTKVFRRLTHVAPREFRKRLRRSVET